MDVGEGVVDYDVVVVVVVVVVVEVGWLYVVFL